MYMYPRQSVSFVAVVGPPALTTPSKQASNHTVSKDGSAPLGQHKDH